MKSPKKYSHILVKDVYRRPLVSAKLPGVLCVPQSLRPLSLARRGDRPS